MLWTVDLRVGPRSLTWNLNSQFVTGSMNKELPGQESGGEAEPYISLPFTVHISTLKALGGPVE